MATGLRRPVEEWKLLVSRFKESGMTQKAFSEEAGIKVCSLQYWLRKISSDDEASSARFVELKTRAGFSAGGVSVSLQIGSDVTISFATLPPPTYLAELSREMKTC